MALVSTLFPEHCVKVRDLGMPGRHAAVELQGGISKSIQHPDWGLRCCETTVMPTVAQLQVYRGRANADCWDPSIASETKTMRKILKQECFQGCATSGEEGEISTMFLSFVDGDIVGGRLPSSTQDRPMHVGWANSEYYRIERGRTHTAHIPA